ncbi:aquaporin-11 [Schistocerca serialis cubense]|uniref:aquaporin-11 n=1 Tax=Schistocerca serialis cubense TaxID=2023355 RepID=UPI00214E0279|nr:aquaporin-11 [Schistocerca serialis cubense]
MAPKITRALARVPLGTSARRGLAMKPYAFVTINKQYGEAGVAMAIPALAVSVSYLLLTALLAAVLRRLVCRLFEQPLLRRLALEAVAAAELCGSCFELIIVADNYGVWAYAAFLFLLTVWWSSSWGEATACPYTHLEDVLRGCSDVLTALLMTGAELAGGVFVFRYVQYLWDLELAETHLGKAWEECSADLQVPMFTGAAIEGAATCACRLVSRALNERETPLANVLDAFFSTALVVAAFNYTGGYFNPVLASSLKYDCPGNTYEEHIIVYWVGSCLGAAASVNLYNHPTVQQLLFTGTKKKEE